MKTITVDPTFWAYIQGDSTAIALAIIFAFLGAVFFAPTVTK